MKFGIDRLIEDADLRRPLAGKRVALLAHPASVTRDLVHSLDALSAIDGINITAAFGPQHGLRGDKQDNMIESPDYNDPVHDIPVFSLYGEVRRPTGQSMGTFDVILIDLQDLGCRIYTFITTLRYMLEAAAEHGKTVWVLDRPNPAGRPIEGTLLEEGWESFVGAGPMPMRHGLTMGEMGRWMVSHFNLDVDYQVIEMQGWQPEGPGSGWPADRKAPQWLKGCALREIWFELTFHKHQGQLCNGVQIHAEGPVYDHHGFRPWRLQALALKAIRKLYFGYELWRDFPYEYEEGRLAFDVINGGPSLREWIDNPSSIANDLEAIAAPDERLWGQMLGDFLLY